MAVEHGADTGEPTEGEPFVIPPESPPPHPSTEETRQFRVDDVARAAPSEGPPPAPSYQPPVSAVPAEAGNRTLWIILAIVAGIVLVCCCLLPLGLLTVASVDTAFQEEIRSAARLAGF